MEIRIKNKFEIFTITLLVYVIIGLLEYYGYAYIESPIALSMGVIFLVSLFIKVGIQK